MSEGRTGGCLAGLLFLGVSAGLAGCFGVCFLPTFGCVGLTMIDVSTATTAKAKVVGHRWERTVEIEELSRDYDEDWCRDVPKGGHIVDEWYEERGDFAKGQRCKYWTLDWQYSDSVTKKGKGLNPKPTWPKTPNDKCSKEGCRRGGTKRASYWVTLDMPKGSNHECDVSSAAKWTAYKKGSSVQVDVGGLMGIVYCDTLK